MKQIIKHLCMAFLAITAVINAACTCIFIKAFGRKKEAAARKNRRLKNKSDDCDQRMDKFKKLLQKKCCEEVHLKSYDGLDLCGRLYMPDNSVSENIHIFLCIHGYHSDGIGDFAPFTPYLEKHGYIYCLVDDRAHGKSEGKYIGFGYHDLFDCMVWIKYLSQRFGPDCSIYLHGISMGASTVLSCCDSKKLPSQVRGIISDCAYSSGWEQLAHILQSRLHIPAFPVLQIYNKICKALGGYNLKDISPLRHVARSKVPILFIHGDSDHFVPTSMVYKLYHACKGPKRLLVIHNAAHAQSYLTDPASYEKALDDFIWTCEHTKNP